MATRRELESLLGQLETADGLDRSLRSDVSRARGSLNSAEKSWSDIQKENLLFRARHAGNTRVNGQDVRPLSDDERAILGIAEGGGLIGQSGGAQRSASRQRGIIGADQMDKPEQYIYRDLKPGEKYDSGTDVRVQVDGEEPGFRRREVNPEYQQWVVSQARDIKAKESGGGDKASPAPASVIASAQKLMTERRDAKTAAERARIDEQLSMYRTQYPSLFAGGAAPNANISVQGGVQQAVEQGMPENVANQLLGAAALRQGGGAEGSWEAPQDQIEFSFAPSL